MLFLDILSEEGGDEALAEEFLAVDFVLGEEHEHIVFELSFLEFIDEFA